MQVHPVSDFLDQHFLFGFEPQIERPFSQMLWHLDDHRPADGPILWDFCLPEQFNFYCIL
jgi:hypothetical protein